MVHAYVTIITGTGASEGGANTVRDLSGVIEAHVVTGDFDVVAEIEGETVRDLQRIVSDGIHETEGVGTTRTYIQLD